jgi:hypothetical protein
LFPDIGQAFTEFVTRKNQGDFPDRGISTGNGSLDLGFVLILTGLSGQYLRTGPDT